MNFAISTTKRNLMILSAAFLIAYSIYNAFYFMGLNTVMVKPNSMQLIIRGLLHTIPYVYLLIVLFDYFRHKGWKLLQYTLLIAVIMEVAIKAYNMIHLMGSFKSASFNFTMGVEMFRVLFIVLLTILLFQHHRKEHPEVFSLQKYAVSLILFQIIAFGIPVVFRSESVSSMLLIIRILSAIPYLFLIEFTLKVKPKKAMVYDSRVNS